MPHALFLGSMMATQDRVSEAPQEVLPNPSQATIKSRIREKLLNLFSIDRADRESSTKDYRSKYGERENNSLTFIREHLSHGIIDIVASLIAIAVPINSASVLFLKSLSFACWSAIVKEFSSLLRPSFTLVLILMETATALFQLDYLRPMILLKLGLEVVSLLINSSKRFDNWQLCYVETQLLRSYLLWRLFVQVRCQVLRSLLLVNRYLKGL